MWDLLKRTFLRWYGSNVFEHAAALAYSTLFAMAPTLILIIGISGIVFGQEAAEGRIFAEINGLIGADSAALIQKVIRQASLSGHDVLATIVGGILFLFGATTVFASLKSSLNEMWCVRPNPQSNDIVNFFKTRLLSLAMVIAFCFILLVSLILSATLTAFGDLLSMYFDLPPMFLSVLNFVISTGTIVVVFAMIFKVLPDVRLLWRDVWLGAAVTALLFAGGKYLIALYIATSSLAGVYGAAGSLVVVMLWVYYSSLILFFGSAFTQAYTTKRKRKLQPAEDAVWYRTEIVKGEREEG